MTQIISAECPHCLAQLKVRGENTVGKKVRCPKCEERFVIQAPAAAAEVATVDPDDDFLSTLSSAVAHSSRRRAAVQVPGRTKPTVAQPRRFDDYDLPEEKPKHDEDDGMLAPLGAVGWVIGGALAGAIGAGIWASIGYSTGFESGWIAWGVGALVGAGVRASTSQYGTGPGATAAALALVSVVFGKFLIAWFCIDQLLAGMAGFIQPEAIAISRIEEQVVNDFEKQGKEIERFDFDEGGVKKAALVAGAPVKEKVKYAAVEAEAKKRWAAMSPQEQQAAKAKVEAEIKDAVDPAREFGVKFVFKELLFTPWTLLWFGLAGVTAYKVGSGLGSDDD